MTEMVKCAQCGKEHPRSMLERSFKRPDVVHAMPKDERKANVHETDDQCRIKNERFFVRGVIPLTVAGRDRAYAIGAWVEIDETVYRRIAELWDDPNQATEPPFPATIANSIRSLPETLGLPVSLKLTGPTTRPHILVPPCKHPLHREQCAGITEHRAHEYSGT
jgi:hypothetical protein